MFFVIITFLLYRLFLPTLSSRWQSIVKMKNLIVHENCEYATVYMISVTICNERDEKSPQNNGDFRTSLKQFPQFYKCGYLKHENMIPTLVGITSQSKIYKMTG